MAEKITYKRAVLKFNAGQYTLVIWIRDRKDRSLEKDLKTFIDEWSGVTKVYEASDLVNFINSKRPGLAMTEEQFTAYKNSSNVS